MTEAKPENQPDQPEVDSSDSGKPGGEVTLEGSSVSPASGPDGKVTNRATGSTSAGGRSSGKTSSWGRFSMRLSRSFDNFAFFAVKALAFGLIAAAAGVAAFLVVQRQAGSTQSVQEIVAAEIGPNSAELEIIRGEIAKLEAAIHDPRPIAEEFEGVFETLAAVRQDLESLREAAEAGRLAQQVSIDELAQTVAALNQRIAILEDQPVPLPSKTGVPGAAELDEKVTGIEQRVSGIEAAMAAVPSVASAASPEPPGWEAVLASLAGRVAELESSPEDGPELAELRQAVDLLSQQVTELKLQESEEASSLLEARLDAVESEVDSLLRAEAGAGELSAEGLALVGIRAAIETGAPYAALIADAGLDSEGLPEAFLAHADTGVSTMPELRNSFAEYARSAIRSAGGSRRRLRGPRF